MLLSRGSLLAKPAFLFSFQDDALRIETLKIRGFLCSVLGEEPRRLCLYASHHPPFCCLSGMINPKDCELLSGALALGFHEEHEGSPLLFDTTQGLFDQADPVVGHIHNSAIATAFEINVNGAFHLLHLPVDVFLGPQSLQLCP